MNEFEQAQANETAHSVCEMIAFCFLNASTDHNFYMSAVEGLVMLADRLLNLNDQQALHTVIGALSKLDYKYARAARV